MTDSTDRARQNQPPWLEIAALIAIASIVVTGPLGLLVGLILVARSGLWDAREKILADTLAIPMAALFLQPFRGRTGLVIGIIASAAAVAIVIPLCVSAVRKQHAVPATGVSGNIASRSGNPAVLFTGWLLTAVAGFGAWWAWMGWDGDDFYDAWQVTGSALTVLVIVLVAWRFLPNKATVSAITIGYSTGWGVSLMPGDDSGMSGVGLIMVAAGALAASTVIVVLADVVLAAARSPRSN